MMMRRALITTIPKKGSRLVLKNHRGIFRVSLVKNLMMSKFYNEKYIDMKLADLNVGARKGRSSRDNIFVINAVINEAV